MHPIQSYHITPSYISWDQLDLTRFIAAIDTRWCTSIPPLEVFGQVVELLKKQEDEILTFPQGQEILSRFPANPANPLFYFQRERWLDAYNKIEFWKHLPGGAEYLKPELRIGCEESLAPELAEWMLQRPEVLNLKILQIFKGPLTRLPPEIGLCTQLQALMIMHTSIEELPPQFGELIHLKLLLLCYNRLRRLCPEFRKLQSLERLELTKNLLEDIDPVGFLRNLKKLSAEWNRIQKLPAELHWGKLDIIDLSENQISELPQNFYNIISLTLIILSGNKLSAISDRISQLTELDTLVLSKNQLSTIPSSLGKTKKLRCLCFTHNQVAEIPESLLEAPCLKEIVFRENPLSHRPEFLPARIWTDIKTKNPSFQG